MLSMELGRNYMIGGRGRGSEIEVYLITTWRLYVLGSRLNSLRQHLIAEEEVMSVKQISIKSQCGFGNRPPTNVHVVTRLVGAQLVSLDGRGHPQGMPLAN